MLPNFKMYYKQTIIKMSDIITKTDTNMNGIKQIPEVDSYTCGHLIQHKEYNREETHTDGAEKLE